MSAPAPPSPASSSSSSSPAPSSSGRAAMALCAALIGYAFGYTLPAYLRLPRAFYDPIARHWWWGKSTTAIPMGYLGQLVWGAGGALVAGALGWLGARKPPSERAYGLVTAWTLTALAIVAAYFTWNNWP